MVAEHYGRFRQQLILPPERSDKFFNTFSTSPLTCIEGLPIFLTLVHQDLNSMDLYSTTCNRVILALIQHAQTPVQLESMTGESHSLYNRLKDAAITDSVLIEKCNPQTALSLIAMANAAILFGKALFVADKRKTPLAKKVDFSKLYEEQLQIARGTTSRNDLLGDGTYPTPITDELEAFIQEKPVTA